MNLPWSKQAANPYLAGNFAPVAEEITATDLDVSGELPLELSGRYLRNGPNPISRPKDRSYHWFIGDGMVHGIRLAGGRAEWYRNRYIGSADVAKARGQADIDGPNWNNNGHGPNTNVAGFAGTTWATVEAVFVPKAHGSAEDDGWLLTFVHDLRARSAEFVVIDAADFARGYVARVKLPQRIPFGFHGNWVDDASVPPG